MAVAEAHRLDVVHGDLKPENVLVTPKGTLFVTDFGLGKAGSAKSDYRVGPGTSSIQFDTPYGEIRGTPCYMSPEQAQAKPATKQSDVYSLGATLYFLLKGEPPYRGSSDIEIIRLVASEEQQPARPKGPSGLARICRKAMSQYGSDRYGDAAALSRALSRWLWWTTVRQVGAIAGIVIFLVVSATVATHFSARHLKVDANDDSVMAYCGLPWLRSVLPSWPLYDTGLASGDLIPSKRVEFSEYVYWFWDSPQSERQRTVGTYLRPSAEFRWRVYCDDWSSAAKIHRLALLDELKSEEVKPTLDDWTKLLPCAPSGVQPIVIHMLDDESTIVRESAVNSLAIVGRHDPHEAIARLIEVFERDEPRDVRWSAVLSIGELGGSAPDSALAFLLPILQDDNSNYQNAAALAIERLAQCAPEIVIPRIKQTLKSNSPGVVEHSLAALTNVDKSNGRLVLPELLRIANSDTVDARVQATELLGAFANRTDNQVLDTIRAHLQSSDVDLQVAALRTLRRFDRTTIAEYWDVLLTLLHKSHPLVQYATVDTIVIGELEWHPEFGSLMLEWLQTESSQRGHVHLDKATWAAGSAPKDFVPAFVDILISLLEIEEGNDDVNRYVQAETAEQSLAQLVDRFPTVVVPRVVNAFLNDPKKRYAAASVFQILGTNVECDAVVVRRLCEIAANSSEAYFHRQSAIEALANVGNSDLRHTVSTLLKLMENQDDRYSVRAALSLGSLNTRGFETCFPRLASLSKSPNWRQRRAAATALARFASMDVTDPRLSLIVSDLLRDKEDVVRETAVQATGELLWAQARGLPEIEDSIAQLLKELQSDVSRLNATYRSGVEYSLTKCLQAMSVSDNCGFRLGLKQAYLFSF